MVLALVGLIAMSDTINVGDRVTVSFGEDSPRSPKEAIVKSLPPTTEKLCGEEITYDTEILVQYLGGMRATEFVNPSQLE